jgi:hypothetical protein
MAREIESKIKDHLAVQKHKYLIISLFYAQQLNMKKIMHECLPKESGKVILVPFLCSS